MINTKKLEILDIEDLRQLKTKQQDEKIKEEINNIILKKQELDLFDLGY